MSELTEIDLCSLMLYEKSFTKSLPYEDARLKVKQTYIRKINISLYQIHLF